MRNLLGLVTVSLGCALISACASEPAPQPQIGNDEAMTLVRSGRPILRCREACLDAWRRAQPQAQQLAATGRWQDLAVLVVRTGYQDDLSLYYLGRAAEGLRNPAAAISYYRQSLQLSGTSLGCTYMSRQCGGVALPGEATMRLAALQPPPGRSRRALPPASPGIAPPPDIVAPPPQELAAPAPGLVAPVPPPPPPPPPLAPADAGEYIEPPPARR